MRELELLRLVAPMRWRNCTIDTRGKFVGWKMLGGPPNIFFKMSHFGSDSIILKKFHLHLVSVCFLWPLKGISSVESIRAPGSLVSTWRLKLFFLSWLWALALRVFYVTAIVGIYDKNSIECWNLVSFHPFYDIQSNLGKKGFSLIWFVTQG